MGEEIDALLDEMEMTEDELYVDGSIIQRYNLVESSMPEYPDSRIWNTSLGYFFYFTTRSMLEYLYLLILSVVNFIRWLASIKPAHVRNSVSRMTRLFVSPCARVVMRICSALFECTRIFYVRYRQLSGLQTVFCWLMTIFLAVCIILAVLIPIYMINVMSFTKQQYIALHNHMLPKNSYLKVRYGPSDLCLLRCQQDVMCSTVQHTPSGSPDSKCHMYRHTPAYYHLQPVQQDWTSIYVKKSNVHPGKKRPEDGFWYFLSAHPMSPTEAESFCQDQSDFYHLAMNNQLNKAKEVAYNMYKTLHKDNRDRKYGIFLHFLLTIPGEPRKAHAYEHVENMEPRMGYIKGPYPMMGPPDTIMGYALCEGDPFNIHGSSLYYRIQREEARGKDGYW